MRARRVTRGIWRDPPLTYCRTSAGLPFDSHSWIVVARAVRSILLSRHPTLTMRSDIAPGNTFPDYELRDQSGTGRRLSEIQGANPMALMLARGGYCPKENWQHRWLAAMEPEIAVGYCKLATISTDSVLESKEWRSRLGAHWPFLADPERTVQQDLDIREYTDPEHDPMIPHTIFLAPGLEIHSVYNGYWYWGRPTPEELRVNFRSISRACRPDWDLSDPEVRARWDRGEKDCFFPYGRKGEG